ncbi:hypothetical protein CP533_2028 [Ophiocordyceps camponoti-saundersi (nom. inval.)]|nr:hypothetical protein CP533_2028 [Ophiocordyceps camponoti-saundersi (nom. inval.)]
MKFLIATALVAALASASESSRKNLQLPHIISNFALPGVDIQALYPVLKKAQCAIPCFEQPIRYLKCDGQGPLQTLCTHFNEIQNQAHPCVEKCGVAPSTISYIGQISRDMCATI